MGCTRAPAGAPVRGPRPGHGPTCVSRPGLRPRCCRRVLRREAAEHRRWQRGRGAGRRWEALGGAGRNEASLVLCCSALGRPASPLRCPEPLIPRVWGGAATRNVTGTGERDKSTCGGSAPKILPHIFPRMLEPWEHPCHGDTWCCGPMAVRQGAKEQLRDIPTQGAELGGSQAGAPTTPQPCVPLTPGDLRGRGASPESPILVRP